MVKGRVQGKASKSQPPRKAANARGYAKRQTLKFKTLGSQLSDVYEYQQEKVRRAKIKPLLEKDETAGRRGDDSGSEDEMGKRREMRPRLVGENDDDAGIGEDEDEEIDSDEAFEESDEEEFAGSKFSRAGKPQTKSKPGHGSRHKAQRAVRFAEVDLNEDQAEAHANEDEEMSEATDEEGEDDEEEDGDPTEFIDVLDVLDGRGEPDTGDDINGVEKHAPTSKPAREESEEVDEDEDMDGSSDSGSEEEDAEEENEPGHISASEDEESEGGASALQDLETFVSGLDAGSKRKAPDDEGRDSEPQRVRKRRLLQERTEAGIENEFAVSSGGKLNLDDLLAPLEGQSSNLLSLKKSAKVLASTSGKIKTLSAPLPQRSAERLDREAAYEQTKEEVDKWKATMQRIQEAEHLSFPLQAEPKSRTSNLQLAAQFKPTTELESAVDKLLKSAKMREDEIAQTESLKMNHLSVEEVSARRAELAKMRDLMFRAEAKAKRIAKIKSKTYRRIRKKERARLAEKLGEGSDDDPDDEEARMKREVERARERATLRHKNTGKWAKSMRERGELDEDQRRDINEMLDRGERLRRKIRGEDEGDSDADSEDESDGEEGEEGISRIKAKAFDELATLDANEPELPADKKGKSIFEMKFMKDAMARQQREAHEIADDFIRELGGGDPDDDEDSPQGDEQTQHVAVQRTGGRVVYRPGALTSGIRPVGSLASDSSSVTLKSTDLPPEAQGQDELSISPPDSPVSRRSVPIPTTDLNPWLAQASGSSKAQTKHEVAVSKTSAATEKSKNKLRKRTQKRLEEKEKEKEDAAVDISLSTVMTLSAPAKAGEPSKPAATPAPSSASKKAKKAEVRGSRAGEDEGDSDSDSDANSEREEQERLAALKSQRKGKAKANGVKAFEQRDLVALAFAGDNVVQDFAEAKRREMAEDAPKEIDTTLPGWGSWGGTGAKKAAPKPYLIKKVAGIDPKSRKDYNKTHVIISEKRDKKAAKYLVKDLPYPYTSKAQFERSMEAPLGTEWNTRLGFQRATLPKVVTKMGTLITPLEKQHS